MFPAISTTCISPEHRLSAYHFTLVLYVSGHHTVSSTTYPPNLRLHCNTLTHPHHVLHTQTPSERTERGLLQNLETNQSLLRGLMAERKQRKSEGKREIVGEGDRAAAASAPASLRETERPAERVREIEREREGEGTGVGSGAGDSGGGVADAAGDGKSARKGTVSSAGGERKWREKKVGFGGGPARF
ncbi:hypothetical protein MRB53_030442 [Persea americana]|uniref:Uncharacterized protein n=1 Tax=Persea americana TaxID=3435 RepID=A0ACC2KLV6_PERAE|nr:hypothetical protein MRB53_030442 [Persea americana]